MNLHYTKLMSLVYDKLTIHYKHVKIKHDFFSIFTTELEFSNTES